MLSGLYLFDSEVFNNSLLKADITETLLMNIKK